MKGRSNPRAGTAQSGVTGLRGFFLVFIQDSSTLTNFHFLLHLKGIVFKLLFPSVPSLLPPVV